jgi:hypothetical protein
MPCENTGPVFIIIVTYHACRSKVTIYAWESTRVLLVWFVGVNYQWEVIIQHIFTHKSHQTNLCGQRMEVHIFVLQRFLTLAEYININNPYIIYITNIRWLAQDVHGYWKYINRGGGSNKIEVPATNPLPIKYESYPPTCLVILWAQSIYQSDLST